MRVIARSVLLAYAERHPETAASLERWFRLIKASDWTSMNDLRQTVPKAKVLNRERARSKSLAETIGWLRPSTFAETAHQFLRTHAEYDAVDALTINMF
jgi:mRNA interferase HigB